MGRRRPQVLTPPQPAPPPGALPRVDDLGPLDLDDGEVARVGVRRASRAAVLSHPSVVAERAVDEVARATVTVRRPDRSADARPHPYLAERRLIQRTEAAWLAALRLPETRRNPA